MWDAAMASLPSCCPPHPRVSALSGAPACRERSWLSVWIFCRSQEGQTSKTALDYGCAMPAQAWDPHLSLWAASLECFRYISPTCLLGPQTFSHPAPSTSGCFWNQMWSKAGFQLGSLSTVYLKSTEPEVMQCKPRQAGHDIPT